MHACVAKLYLCCTVNVPHIIACARSIYTVMCMHAIYIIHACTCIIICMHIIIHVHACMYTIHAYTTIRDIDLYHIYIYTVYVCIRNSIHACACTHTRGRGTMVITCVNER
jgi:hypothetical protein